jgi:cell division septum initiation protein DivIVA
MSESPPTVEQQTQPPGPSSLPVDVEAKLSQLELLVAEAKAVPLSASIMLNRAEIDGLVTELRDALPEEIKRARWILKERDEVLDKARREAETMLGDARSERERLVSRTDVAQAANREADRIVEEAREQARQLRLEAEDYVDAKLANFEVVLNKTLAAVERGREKLRGRLDHEDLVEMQEYEVEEIDTAAVEEG